MLVIGGFDGSLRNDVWEYVPPGVGAWHLLAVGGTASRQTLLRNTRELETRFFMAVSRRM